MKNYSSTQEIKMATFTYFVYYLLHIFVYFGISLIFVCIVSLKYCVPNCVDHHWCEFIIGCFILWWIGQMACINWFNHILLAQVCFHRVFQILGAVFTKLSLYLQRAISSMEVHFTSPPREFQESATCGYLCIL